MSLLPHQERVIQEKKDLDEKIVKLSAFIVSDKSASLDHTEFNLMWHQRTAMLEYSDILGRRIELFGGAA